MFTSNKGGVKLLYEGFVYVRSKALKSGDVSFECELRRNTKQCKAKLRVSGDSVIGRYNDHTHAPDIGRPEALRIRQSIKRRSVDTEETPQQVITQELTSSHPQHPSLYTSISSGYWKRPRKPSDSCRYGAPGGVHSHTCQRTFSVI